jgi:hypothetical protein
MERRYLVATVALVATFAVFSQAFGSGRLTKLPRSRAEARADIACVRRTVAEKLMAALEPYVDGRAPEQAQMVAELNLPELARVEEQSSDAQQMVQDQVERQKCQAAARAQKTAQRVYQMHILSDDRAQKINDMAVIRAEELSSRAQEWRQLADTRQYEVYFKSMEHAQKVSAHAMEQAQRAIEHSRMNMKMEMPHQPGMPIHINFVTPVKMDFTVSVPAMPATPTPTID